MTNNKEVTFPYKIGLKFETFSIYRRKNFWVYNIEITSQACHKQIWDGSWLNQFNTTDITNKIPFLEEDGQLALN